MKSSLSHPASSTIQPEIGLSEVIQLQQELLSTREKLVKAEKKLRTEFDDAAKYIRRMLPPPLTGREMIDWKFQPATHIGGDGLGYRRIDDDQIAFYVLDVAGHGLGSALMAVTALEMLRAQSKAIDFRRPAHVVERLNGFLQMKDHAGKFLSVWYGVYSHSEQCITYANAGHPSPLLLTREEAGAGLVLTKTAPGGAVLGVFSEIEVHETTIRFPTGSELFLFTDGLYETRGLGQQHGSYDEFFQHLQARISEGHPPYESILLWLDEARGQRLIDDDVTLLRFATQRHG